MKVKDLVLYQVATDRNYKVGDKFYFGNTPNGQELLCKDYSCVENGKPLHQAVMEKLNNNEEVDKSTIKQLASCLSQSDFAIRELALEDVRCEKFPHLPSRFRCMFLTDKKELCLAGLKIFPKKGHGKLFQAVKVKLTGEAFFVRENAIGRFGLSYNEYKEKALEYWNQKESEKPVQEILFVGDVEILEILDEIKIG